MGKFRDGMPVTSEAVTLILVTLDRIKAILAELERRAAEPEGADADLIGELETHVAAARAAEPRGREPQITAGALVYQVLERPLKPGEVSLDDLERAFREPTPARRRQSGAGKRPRPKPRGARSPTPAETRSAAPSKVQTIRVNVDTLEHLMTMVSELVLTRNQLLEIARRQDDSGYKVPLQRLSHVTAELQEGVMKTRMQPIGNAWQKLPRVVRDLSAELAQEDRARHGGRRDRARPPGARG